MFAADSLGGRSYESSFDSHVLDSEHSHIGFGVVVASEEPLLPKRIYDLLGRGETESSAIFALDETLWCAE